jgi:septin family protein
MPTKPATATHLSLLADTTFTSLYERSRLLRLGSSPSASDEAEIAHSLDTLKIGLTQLEREVDELEREGGEVKSREEVLRKLQTQVGLRDWRGGGNCSIGGW